MLTLRQRDRIQTIIADIQGDLDGRCKKPYAGTRAEKEVTLDQLRKIIANNDGRAAYDVIAWFSEEGISSLINSLSQKI